MQAVEINTGPDPRSAVIWLHGLGADGHDFEPIVPELELDRPVRFVFPHAPVRPVTINQGMRMRAWYDIFQLGGGPEDEAGVRASQKLLEEMIAAEKQRGMKRIVLAGFSLALAPRAQASAAIWGAKCDGCHGASPSGARANAANSASMASESAWLTRQNCSGAESATWDSTTSKGRSPPSIPRSPPPLARIATGDS